MRPGVGVQLADATPWIVLDVVVPGLTLFLLSRVWVMVAPASDAGFGDGRWSFGCRCCSSASITGRVAAPEEATALSDGIDFTAFVLCFPLGAVSLGACCIRWCR